MGKISEWISEEEKEKGVRIISMAQSRNKSEILKLLLTIEINHSTINPGVEKNEMKENSNSPITTKSPIQQPKQKSSKSHRRKHK